MSRPVSQQDRILELIDNDGVVLTGLVGALLYLAGGAYPRRGRITGRL